MKDTTRKKIIRWFWVLFVAGVMATFQKGPVDIAAHYDSNPYQFFTSVFEKSGFPTKSYSSFLCFNKLYKLGTEIESLCEGENIYAIAAKNENKLSVFISNYEGKVDAVIEALQNGADFCCVHVEAPDSMTAPLQTMCDCYYAVCGQILEAGEAPITVGNTQVFPQVDICPFTKVLVHWGKTNTQIL